ncbi:uncharacterized protein LOC135050001 isoform X2 [Pseudophryne corroboree]|uniref:uncharacterized protein LOC135050001 isoform X2 n=1 Tax=Pseudophryne corroboree TaxID=495146 RepID=UPI003081CF9B
MAPGNKAKTFNGSAKSRPASQQSGSGRKKKKRVKKSAQGKHITEPETTPFCSPLVYDPEMQINPGVRLGACNHISRFEIPMDIKLLENMTVHEYLRNYCRVVKRRQMYYKKFFDKFDKDKDGVLSITEMESALNDVFREIHPGQVKNLLTLTSENNDVFDSKLFFSMCALSERMFYSTPVSEDTSETYTEKQWVESADFSAINWKFDGCNIDKTLKNLFTVLVCRFVTLSGEL